MSEQLILIIFVNIINVNIPKIKIFKKKIEKTDKRSANIQYHFGVDKSKLVGCVNLLKLFFNYIKPICKICSQF